MAYTLQKVTPFFFVGRQSKAKEMFQLKETKEAWQLNVTGAPGLDSVSEKNFLEISWDKCWKWNMNCRLDNSIIAMLNFWIW